MRSTVGFRTIARARCLPGVQQCREFSPSSPAWGRHHKIAGAKGASDAARARTISKLAIEIIAAAKACNGDRSDLRLDNAISRARSMNMPVKNIDAAIVRGAEGKDDTNYETYWLEGHGPNQVAVMVECLTDNKKRTAPRVRNILSKSGGAMGSGGSVEWMFLRHGAVEVKATEEEEEGIFESIMDVEDELLDIDFEDNEKGEQAAFITCQPGNLALVKEAVQKAGYDVKEADLLYKPTQTTPISGEEEEEQLRRFFDRMEEEEDIQRFFHNAELASE
jgi:YebC/PmpR family DNA-binding regulatory protein